MVKNVSNITTYLKQDNKALGSLLLKLDQLQLWNAALEKCLPENAALLQHCKIVKLDGTSLIVIADNPHWVTRFRFFIPKIIQKLRTCPGLEKILAICCKVRPEHYTPQKKIKRQPLTLSAESISVVLEAATKIKDKKLAGVLEKIAKRHRS